MDTRNGHPLKNTGDDSSFSPPSSSNSSLMDHSSPAALNPPLRLLTLSHDTPITPNVSPVETKSGAIQHLTIGHDAPNTGVSPTQPSEAFILRQSSLILDDDCIKKFSRRTQHMFNDFQRFGGSLKSNAKFPMDEIIRSAIWWFLHGRMKLVPLLREGTAFPFAQKDNNILFQEAHLHLAKTLWLLQGTQNFDNETKPENIWKATEFRREGNRTELLSLRLALLTRLRQAMLAMEKSELLSGPLDQSLGDLGASIWAIHPPSDPDINYLTMRHHIFASQESNEDMSLSTTFPLGDSSDAFHYGSIHIDLVLPSDPKQIKYPAIISVVRARNKGALSVVIGSQDGLVNLLLSSDRKGHLAWQDVKWLTSTTCLEAKLRTGFRFQILCSSWDFKVLKGMYDYQNDTIAAFQQCQEEVLIFESDIECTQYHTTRPFDSRSFPADAITHCTLRLFEKSVPRSTGTGSSRVHGGFRIALLTPPWVKNLSLISHEFSPGRAIHFGFLRGEKGNRTLSLKIDNDNYGGSLILAFADPQQRNTLLAHLTGCFTNQQETVLAQIQLNSFSITTGVEQPSLAQGFDKFQWQGLRVIHDGQPSGVEINQQTLSESLRIIVDSPTGRITDRVNVGIGELKIRRNVISSGHELHILRQPQEDLTLSLSDLTVPVELPKQLQGDLEAIQTEPSFRIYSFPNLSELHFFQSAITGSTVLFDGTPSSFSISRRRAIVPIHKEWSSPHTRIQILRRGKVVQLVAFFEGFSHGKCMNFKLKGTDVFTKFTKGGTTFLKIVDAKFSLPMGGKYDIGRDKGFACLDMLDYPGEHDNISLGFSGDSDFERFSEALPAPVRIK